MLHASWTSEMDKTSTHARVHIVLTDRPNQLLTGIMRSVPPVHSTSSTAFILLASFAT